MEAWATIAGVGSIVGIALVIAAWVKREREWAPKAFWIGVILVAIPMVWAMGSGFAEGLRHGVTEAAR